MYTACATVKCGGAECALWWSVLVVISYIPSNVSLCVPALYGMAAASRRVIGYRTECFACRPFFRPFVVSFFQSPLPIPLSPQLLFSRTWQHTTHTQSEGASSYISSPLSLWPFLDRLLGHLPYPHTVHEAEEYCVKACAPA